MGASALLIDQDEEESGMAEFMAELHHTFEKCRAGQGDEVDWAWLASNLGLAPNPIICMPMTQADIDAPLPF